jgi:hypothetical protein
MLAFVPEKVIIYRIFAAVLLCFSVFAWAGFPLKNMSPVALYVGMPELKTAQKLADGEMEYALNASINSHFIPETDEKDALFFDAESYVGDFVWRRGFAAWEIEVIVPYVSYQEGFMDSFMIRWHNIFDLPGGNRESVKNNQFQIAYFGHDQLLLTTPAEGVGDMRVQWGKSIVQAERYQHAIHMSLKLPTGDVSDGLGSGSSDLSIFSTHAWQQTKWQQELQIGMVLMDKPKVLASQRRDAAFFASAALTYTLDEGWFAVLQYDAHSPLYKNTDQPALGDAHFMSVGSRWQIKHWQWHMVIIEDIDVDSSPDVGFQLGINYKN